MQMMNCLLLAKLNIKPLSQISKILSFQEMQRGTHHYRSNSNLHGNFIKGMISEISVDMVNFLNHLNSKFTEFGISFNVSHQHQTLMRILTPFELLSHYGLADNSCLLKESNQFHPYPNYLKTYQTGHKNKPSNQLSSSQISQSLQSNESSQTKNRPNPEINKKQLKVKKQEISNYRMERGHYDDYAEHTQTLTKMEVLKNSRKVINPEDIKKKHIYRINNGGKPILTPQEQNEVCKFIYAEVRKGRVLLMSEIALFAKKIYKNSNFQASLGWVKNFLKRNPQMRELYDVSRRGQQISFNEDSFFNSEAREQSQKSKFDFENSFYDYSHQKGKSYEREVEDDPNSYEVSKNVQSLDGMQYEHENFSVESRKGTALHSRQSIELESQ